MTMYKGQQTTNERPLLNIIGALTIVIISMMVMFFSAFYGLTKVIDEQGNRIYTEEVN